MPSVTVVMGVYNGAKYLRSQLDSLLAQSYTDWRLLVRDDGSSDESPLILQEYEVMDTRIRVLRDSHGNLGAVGNFDCLLRAASDADFVLCADQDDVWDLTKVEQTVAALNALAGSAAAVFTDYRVIDSCGRVVKPEGLAADAVRRMPNHDVCSLLAYDYVWGCTLGVTSDLLRIALPIPEEAENHDYWLALVAASLGALRYLDVPTLSYRKHDANVTGGLNRASWSARIGRVMTSGPDSATCAVVRRDLQAKVLLDRMRTRGAGARAQMLDLERYVSSTSHDAPWSRLMVERRLGVRMQGRLQQAGRTLAVLRVQSGRRNRGWFSRAI